MQIKPLIADMPAPTGDAQADRISQWARQGLSVPPGWAVSLGDSTSFDSSEFLDQLSGLPDSVFLPSSHGADPQEGYWILRQGPAQEGSLRDQLVNLDSNAAVASAASQIFSADPHAVLTIHYVPAQKAVGILFTRHPLRPDLDHVILEGVAGDSNEQQRIVFQADGSVGYQSVTGDSLVDLAGSEPFLKLADLLAAQFDAPQACEWVWDGGRLWVLQTLPIGSLPTPGEAWCSRTGFGLWNQAVSPLWYTLEGRWLKNSFWRKLGDKMGWDDLSNVEPYRRLHSHIYSNGEFVRRLQSISGYQAALRNAIPPAWRKTGNAEVADGSVSPPSYARLAFSMTPLSSLSPRFVGHKLQRNWNRLVNLSQRATAYSHRDLWLLLMKLDRAGERLALEEATAVYLRVEQKQPAPDNTRPVPLSFYENGRVSRLLQDLLQASVDETDQPLPDASLASIADNYSLWGPGADPVMPRFSEKNGDLRRLLQQLFPGLGEDRKEIIRSLETEGQFPREEYFWQFLVSLRRDLGGLLRKQLLQMAVQLVDRRKLGQPDDVFFLYFDELWQVWQGGEMPPGAQARQILQRKMRYLSDARRSVPDWVMDQISYGVGHDEEAQPVMAGEGLVTGTVTGKVRIVRSFWSLDELDSGEILVVDECDPGWLPWMVGAAGLVIARKDRFHPAASLAVELGIPAVWAADDAANCLRDGIMLTLDGEHGTVDLAD